MLLPFDSLKEKIPKDKIGSVKFKPSFDFQTNNEVSSNTVNSGDCNDYKPRKPSRPCIFCENLASHSNLRRHQMRMHKEKISHILKLPQPQQTIEFKKLRLQGIYQLN